MTVNTFAFGLNQVNCTSTLQTLLDNIGLSSCVAGTRTTIKDGMQLDYIFYWKQWKSIISSDVDQIAAFEVKSSSLISYLDSTIGAVFGGQLSDHLPITVEFTIPRPYDPSFLLISLAFGLFISGFVTLLIYLNCCITHVDKIATDEERKSGICGVIMRQTIILLNKNFTLMFRSKRSLCIQILVPFAFVSLLSVLQI